MTTDTSEPPPEEGEPPDDDAFRWPTGSESPGEVGKTAVRGLLAAFFFRLMFFQSLIWLFLGAGFLMGAWALVREEMTRRETLAAFDGRAEGTLEAPWWRLDLDPDVLGDGTNWQALAMPEVCARLRFRPEGGAETTTVYCRRFQGGIGGADFFTWEEALGPVPVRWVDARGMPRIEIRLTPRLARWLDARGPEADVFWDADSFHGPERARRADRLLAGLWRDLDDPFFHLLEEWSRPAPAVTVAYDSGDPARAAPLPVLRSQFTVPSQGAPMPGWVLAILLGVFGLAAWAAGAHLITGGSRRATAVVVIGALAVLPWASGFADKALGHLWGGAELALTFIRTEMLDLPPELVLDAPDRGGDPEAVTVAWTLESSYYAELLRWVELRPPAEATGDDAVLQSLDDQVVHQAAALPDDELAALLAWAASVQERGEGEEVGLLFVDAALELEGDEGRSEEVRRQARRVLDALHRYPPSDNPYRLAVAERARLLARVPPP